MSRAYKKVANPLQPVDQVATGRTDQVKNKAGGLVFDVGVWERVRRFLILGSEGGSYYATERELTRENFDSGLAAIQQDGKRFVDMVVEVSDGNLAPKNEPALLALAMAAKLGDDETRRYAWQHVKLVCRTGTHFLHFIAYARLLGKWNRMSRDGVASWFLERHPDKLARQLTKYQSRDGMSMRDLLRMAHVKAKDPAHSASLRWAVAGPTFGERIVARQNQGNQPSIYPEITEVPRIIEGYELAKQAKSAEELVKLIGEYGLEREHIPTHWLNSPNVWRALLPNLGSTALIRNLGKLTSVGLLTSQSPETEYVVQRLSDYETLTQDRVHPMTMLVANRTYTQGHGDKGKLRWSPVRQIVDVTDEGFYHLYGSVKPMGGKVQFAIDASASMSAPVMGINVLSCREAAVALALIGANVEERYTVTAYTYKDNIREVPISPRQRLSDAMDTLTRLIKPEGTDVSLPFRWAERNSLAFNTFVLLTDNETWSGVHPFQAVDSYRAKTHIQAKWIAVAMTPSTTTVIDPEDSLGLNVVGFDTSAPAVMSAFARGEI